MKKYVNIFKKYTWKDLYIALYDGNIKLAKDILLGDIDQDKSKEFRKSVLFYIIDLGYRDVLEEILNKWNLVHVSDALGCTLLMNACSKNDSYIDIVKLLVEKGADVNVQSSNYKTALGMACQNNNWKIVDFLLAHGANEFIAEKENLLIYAIKHDQEKIIKLFVKYRKEMINLSYMGETPLMLACKYSDVHVVKHLLNNGAKINEVNVCEENALYYALSNKKYARDITIVLVDNGININEDDKVGHFLNGTNDIRLKTILRFRKYGIEGIKKLLNELKDEHDKKLCLICLMISCFFNKIRDEINIEFRELLRDNTNIIHDIIKRCKKREINKNKKTSHYSFNIDIMTELMHNFCAIGNLDIVKSLINIGMDINKRNKNGISALMYACKENQMDIVKYLLSLDVNVNDVDSNQNSAFMYAIKTGNIDIIKELIDHNANINAKNKNGETPLILSIKDKNIKVMKYLLSRGADVNVKTPHGKGSLSFAVKSGDIGIINCLGEYIKDKRGVDKKSMKPKVCIIHNLERIKRNEDITKYLE